MTLTLTTAGESHGPALVAIVTGLPAGLLLERERDRGGPPSAPAGLRAQPAPADRDGRGRGARGPPSRPDARHAARARRPQPRPQELDLGHEPWPPEGEPTGKGKEAVTLPRPGHADLAGVMKYGLDDVRNALERASARHTAAIVAAGGAAKALLARDRRRGRERRRHRGAGGEDRRRPRRAGHRRRRRRGARARRPARARLVRDEGGAARRAPRLDANGHPGGEGRRDRRGLRRSPSCAARRPTTRSCATRAVTAARRTAPAASRPGSRTARRSSSAPA